MAGWSDVFGKVFQWIPGRKEWKQNKITALEAENAKIQQNHPLSARDANKYASNVDTIKRLRSQIERIG